ncbi:hypothetical protein KIN34_14465 [Cellulomonas sp. DKR-3]|uniref:IrrE N-terminal-like domain-containing protein n=1 Tax=Cellulomonas fulva TaxID=2835530 RepID=A0ABS5U296_9CELL|nr:hypothetical protein [Cellulomonas fulva]MBT0995487.1 hypothetical protein [Cellulomonas fulva]
MTYDIHGNVSALLMRAASEGLERVGAPDQTCVVFTDAFSEDVARFTGNASYNVGRGAGVVGARTIPASDGKSVVFVNTSEVRHRDPGEVERLLAHEGGHALLNHRGEDLGGRRGLAGPNWQWEMLCLGALALDEARIETHLRALGYPPTDSICQEHFEDSLYVLNCDVSLALVETGDYVAELARRIVVAQDHLSKLLAYLVPYAGAGGAASPSKLSAAGKRHWDDYVSDLWDARRSLYARCPDASEVVASADLDSLYLSGLQLEIDQLSRLGFERSGNDATEMFVRTATDRRCQHRMNAAIRETEARA